MWPSSSSTGGWSSSRNRSRKFLEEIIRDFFGGAVDKTLAKLCKLAANLCFDAVSQQGAAIFFGQRDRRPTFRKTGHATVALAGNFVAVGRVKIGKMNLTFKARFYWTDFGRRNSLEFSVRGLVEFFTARDARFQNVGVVQLCPHNLATGRQLNLARHGHCHHASPLQASRDRPAYALTMAMKRPLQGSRGALRVSLDLVPNNPDLGEDLNADNQRGRWVPDQCRGRRSRRRADTHAVEFARDHT